MRETGGNGIKPNKKTFVRYGAKDEPEGTTAKQLNKDKGLENCQKAVLASISVIEKHQRASKRFLSGF